MVFCFDGGRPGYLYLVSALSVHAHTTRTSSRAIVVHRCSDHAQLLINSPSCCQWCNLVFVTVDHGTKEVDWPSLEHLMHTTVAAISTRLSSGSFAKSLES